MHFWNRYCQLKFIHTLVYISQTSFSANYRRICVRACAWIIIDQLLVGLLCSHLIHSVGHIQLAVFAHLPNAMWKQFQECMQLTHEGWGRTYKGFSPPLGMHVRVSIAINNTELVNWLYNLMHTICIAVRHAASDHLYILQSEFGLSNPTRNIVTAAASHQQCKCTQSN